MKRVRKFLFLLNKMILRMNKCPFGDTDNYFLSKRLSLSSLRFTEKLS